MDVIGPIHTLLGWESWAEISAIFMKKRSWKKRSKQMAKKKNNIQHWDPPNWCKQRSNIGWGKRSHFYGQLTPTAPPITKVQLRLHHLPHQDGTWQFTWAQNDPPPLTIFSTKWGVHDFVSNKQWDSKWLTLQNDPNLWILFALFESVLQYPDCNVDRSFWPNVRNSRQILPELSGVFAGVYCKPRKCCVIWLALVLGCGCQFLLFMDKTLHRMVTVTHSHWLGYLPSPYQLVNRCKIFVHQPYYPKVVEEN